MAIPAPPVRQDPRRRPVRSRTLSVVRAAATAAVTMAMIVPPATGAFAIEPSQPGAPSPVTVVDLSVDGRYDEPRGIGNAQPSVGWRMTADDAPGNPCFDPTVKGVCALDRQIAYEVEVASSVEELESGELLWDSGRVESSAQSVTLGTELDSREDVAWRVRVWDAKDQPTAWSEPSTFTVGLLDRDDWGDARWIEQAGRTESQPMPIFARQFEIPGGKEVSSATLYLSGVGMHHATVNGEDITDEVLAPGYSNYQLSSEYRTYDITSHLADGANAIGVELGNGPAYVRRSVTNPAVGRTSPYSWWQSQLKGDGTLAEAVEVGATNVKLSSVTGYHVGGTINIDTGDGGERLESRVITAIGTAGATGTGITFEPALDAAHAGGARVTGSGNNVAASDASAGAAVTPRFIGRVEVDYSDGTSDVIVTDRDWRAASGALVTDAWYSGSDYDARLEQPGWNESDADLSTSATRRDGTTVNWAAAGFAPPPNLDTELVARDAEPIVEFERFTPKSVTNPAPGTWVFDFGQNIVGWPELKLPELPAGTVVKVKPAESLNADGTVNQSSLGPGGRGRDLFNTYTTAGLQGGEVSHPKFNYFGMQWVQIEGLPAGFTPTSEIVTGVRVQADVPVVNTFESSNERINRINTMVHYSFAGNIMSLFTDCPGREKLSYPADYTMPMGGIHRTFELEAYLRTQMHSLVEGQSLADSPMYGNVALKTPVYDWGYTGRFGDEINWGNAIVLVPATLYELYGDTETMTRYWDNMVTFVEYIQRQKVGTGANEHIVDAALGDWVAADQTSGRITGTWGYYVMITKMAKMAELTGHDEEAEQYSQLADEIKAAYNAAFLNTDLGYYTAAGDAGTMGATQAAQALALDAGLVPDEYRDSVVARLVAAVQEFAPNGGGAHFSAGTIGLAAVVRQLTATGNDQLLFDVLQEDTYPSYGYFMEPTVANPEGFTTIGERWTRGDSKNHMILAQIVEWFQTGLVGIRGAEGTIGYKELVFQPKPAGDLTHVKGSFVTPQGTAASEWAKSDERFTLTVEVPANTTAEVWVPSDGKQAVLTPARATFDRIEGDYAVYEVGAGRFTFVVPSVSYEDVDERLSALIEDGSVSADAGEVLGEHLERAAAQARDGHAEQAVKALETLLSELAKPQRTMSDAARGELTGLVQTVLDELRAASGAG